MNHENLQPDATAPKPSSMRGGDDLNPAQQRALIQLQEPNFYSGRAGNPYP